MGTRTNTATRAARTVETSDARALCALPGRRSILKAGAVAIGAALLPTRALGGSAPLSREDLLAGLRAEYLARVRVYAERIRPQITAAIEGLDDPEYLYDDVVEQLENECVPAFCPTEDAARLTWALTPHWNEDSVTDFEDVRLGVACLVARDVADALAIPMLTAHYDKERQS